MKNIILFIFLLLVFIPVSKLLSQPIKQDSILFKTIEETNSFCHWQSYWKQISNDFNLNDFYLDSEQKLKYYPKAKFTFESIQERKELLLTFFSPNGLKAINPFSYDEVYIHDSVYVLGRDDYDAIELYDFTIDSAYYIFPLYMYGPRLNGIAWLNDSVFVIVGDVFKEMDSKEYVPLIYIFNIDLRIVRIYKGKTFLLTKEQISKMDYFSNDVELIFKYGKNLKIKKKF